VGLESNIARHVERNLAAVVDNPDLFLAPVTITLKPAATLIGQPSPTAPQSHPRRRRLGLRMRPANLAYA